MTAENMITKVFELSSMCSDSGHSGGFISFYNDLKRLNQWYLVHFVGKEIFVLHWKEYWENGDCGNLIKEIATVDIL
jgi:hypothetical protein